MFNLTKKCQTVLKSGCIFWIPAIKVWEFQLLHTLINTWNAQLFCVFVLLGWIKSLFGFFHKILQKKTRTNFLANPIVILIDVLWLHTVVLICIFRVTNDVKHLFMCLLAIPIFSLMKCLCKSFAHFFKKLGWWFSYYCILRVLRLNWIQVFYQIYDFKYFSQCVVCIF